MGLLTRDVILSVRDFPTEEIEVPEWGGSVMVRGLSAKELDDFEQSRLSQKRGKVRLDLTNTRARLVSLTVVDADGKRLFTDADVAALGRKSGKALDRVYEAAARLSGIKEEDIEELAKNLEPTQPA